MKLSYLACFAAGWLLAPRRRDGGPATIALAAVPDRRRRPSDGVVAEASIVARILRLRLLALNATVVVSPAEVTARSSAARSPARSSMPSSARDAARLPVAAGRSLAPPPARSEPIGRRLAEAVRSLDEGAALLAESRRTDRRVASSAGEAAHQLAS